MKLFFTFGRIGKNAGKGENVGNHHFPTRFSVAVFLRVVKSQYNKGLSRPTI